MSAKGDKTKELICSEAYKLFAEKGFKEVTMKDICEKTGLSEVVFIDTIQVPKKFFLISLTLLCKHKKMKF